MNKTTAAMSGREKRFAEVSKEINSLAAKCHKYGVLWDQLLDAPRIGALGTAKTEYQTSICLFLEWHTRWCRSRKELTRSNIAGGTVARGAAMQAINAAAKNMRMAYADLVYWRAEYRAQVRRSKLSLVS